MLADIIPLGSLTPITFLIIGGIKYLLNLHRAARLDVYVGLLPPLCRMRTLRPGGQIFLGIRVEQVSQDSNPSP